MIFVFIFLISSVISDWDFEFSVPLDPGQNKYRLVKYPCGTDTITFTGTPDAMEVFLMTYKQIKDYFNGKPADGFKKSTATKAGQKLKIEGRKDEYYIVGINNVAHAEQFSVKYECSDNPTYSWALEGFLWVLGMIGFCCVICYVFGFITICLVAYTFGITAVKKAIWKDGNEDFTYPTSDVLDNNYTQETSNLQDTNVVENLDEKKDDEIEVDDSVGYE